MIAKDLGAGEPSVQLVIIASLALLVGLSLIYLIILACKRPEPTIKVFSKLATVEPPRYVVLSEAGNIMVSTSHDPTKKLPERVERIFLEAVSSLCLITRAIASTIDPETNEPYSIYDQDALERVLASHPLFVHLGSEEAEYKVRRNADFIEKASNDLFGTHKSQAVNRKMKAIYNSMNVAAQIGMNRGRTRDARVGHLTLFCEDILGVPVISAVIVHLGYDESEKLIKQERKSMWNIMRDSINYRKDTYLFNSPTLQSKYGPKETLSALNTKLNAENAAHQVAKPQIE